VIGENEFPNQYEGCISVTEKNSQFIIGLGSVTTGADTGNSNIKGLNDVVLVAGGSAWVGSQYFGNVPLNQFMEVLPKVIPKSPPRNNFKILLKKTVKYALAKASFKQTDNLNWKNVVEVLNHEWVKSDDVTMCVDVSFSLPACKDITINNPNSFVS
jgi:hypothetical protein